MLGIMEGPNISPHPQTEESEENKDKLLTSNKPQTKNGTITDFFKSPTNAVFPPVVKPANLFGYFSQKSPSMDTQVPKAKQASPPKGGEVEEHCSEPSKPDKKTSDKKTSETKKTSKNSKVSRAKKSKGDQTASHLQGLILQLHQGMTNQAGTSKGKRKKLPSSPNASSADDFDSPPPRPKRPKVEPGKRAKKAFSFSEGKESSQSQEAASYDLAESAAGGGDASEEADERTGSREDGDGHQDARPENKVQIISYEDFLSSEMDDNSEKIWDDSDKPEGENDRRNMVLLSDSEEEEDQVFVISPGGKGNLQREGKEEKVGVNTSMKREQGDSGSVSESSMDGFVPLDDSKSEPTNCEETVPSGGSMKDEQKTDQSEQNDIASSQERRVSDRTPVKSDLGEIFFHQSPQLVVEALVHSPQSGSGQGTVCLSRKAPMTPKGRVSNVALDDAENEISVIEVVKAPAKPLYSIFMKKPKGGKKLADGDSKGKQEKMDGKSGQSGDDFEDSPEMKSPKKGKRGRKRKPKQGKKVDRKVPSDKPKEPSSSDRGEEKKSPAKKRGRGRPRKIVRNEEEDEKSRKGEKVTVGRPKGSTKTGKRVVEKSSEEDSGEGRRTLRPRRSASREPQMSEQSGSKQEEKPMEGGRDDATEEVTRGSTRGKAGKGRKIPPRKNAKKADLAQHLLRKAKSQKAQGLGQRSIGQGSLNRTGKLKLRVTLDPLDLSGKGKIIRKNLTEKAEAPRKIEEVAKKEERRAVTSKEETKKAPVKVAAMFTKEGRKSLAKKQQEVEEIEVHSLLSSSDDENSADAAPSYAPGTPLRRQTPRLEETELMTPFPDVSHILQKEEMSSGDKFDWWDLPGVDQSKLKMKDIDQSLLSVSELTNDNALLQRITLSHLEGRAMPEVEFTGHPELSYEEQKAALEAISNDSPQYPVKRIFKRYLAKRKGVVPEPAKVKGDKANPKESQASRKRKPEDDPEGSERKVRRSSRGRSVKEQKPTKVNNVGDTVEKENNEGLSNDASNLRDLLWSDKYQPASSDEVLVGNKASVTHLKSWLNGWKIKIGKIKKKEAKAMRGNNKSVQSARASDDSESDFELSDAGSGSEDEDDDGLCNTFLITGSHGVGKTSAVYACAREMGFKVIEVNASSKRVGRQILDDLGEATQSHHLTGQAGLKTADLARFFKLKTPPALAKPKAPPKPKMPKAFAAFVKAGSKKAEDQKPTSKTKPSPKKAAPSATPKKIKAALQGAPLGAARTPASKKCSQPSLGARSDEPSSSGASLILFDEVDIVFEEDKGFLHAINTFMGSTKRPIFLTTSDPRFGECLDGRYEHVRMQKPETNKLATSMQLLCLAENVRTSRQDMLNLVSHCNNDLRRCLHNLQTWVNTGAMLSSWQRAEIASPRKRVCKLSLKRLKGTTDYSCLVDGDQADDKEVKSAPSMVQPLPPPKIHCSSALSVIGCPPDVQQDFLCMNHEPLNKECPDVYSSIRKLLRCGTDPVRNLERNLLHQAIPDLPEGKQTSGDEPSSTDSSEVQEDGVKPGIVYKQLQAKSLDQLSKYSDNLCDLDFLERKTDLHTGGFGGGEFEWWRSNTHAGLEDASDNQASRWHLEDLSEEVRSVIEWENFSISHRRLKDIFGGSERTVKSNSTPDGATDMELLKMNPEPRFDTNSLYEPLSRKLPRYMLSSHRSVTLDYLPAMRLICHSERLREAAQRKRRFLHYFDAASFSVKHMEKIQLASIAAHFTWREQVNQEEDHIITEDENSNL